MIVIGGCPRSGTTLLRRLLDEHPHIVCGPETSALLPGRPSPAELAYAYDLPGSEVSALLAASHSQGEFVTEFFGLVAARRGKRRWAEKTPLNVRHLTWIYHHFPNARFIHVIRDGRDVVCSLRSHPVRRFRGGAWASIPQNRSVASCIGQWLALTGAGMRWRNDPRYLEVFYEDLVRSPEATMRRVMAFVGELFDEAWLAARLADQSAQSGAGPGSGMVAHTSAAISSGAAPPNAAGAIRTGSIGRWRRDLTPAEVAFIRERATRRLVDLGYESRGDWT